jgi:hypothetical protein
MAETTELHTTDACRVQVQGAKLKSWCCRIPAAGHGREHFLVRSEGVCPINLSRVIREAAAAMLPFAEENGRLLEVDAPDMVSTLGRSDDLRGAVRNLLENALTAPVPSGSGFARSWTLPISGW